ncbi:MAG TPA: hypothetical protein V6C88_12470 [Chroococcidiopsis sp.]
MGENLQENSPTDNQLSTELEAIAALVRHAAQAHQNNSQSLLLLLRLIEALHQEIRDGLFQDSLPDNRQALYSLLKNIEAEGGWPYIHRMRLQDFLIKFLDIPQPEPDDMPLADSDNSPYSEPD